MIVLKCMTVLQGLPYAFFCFLLVFVVLITLWILIRLFSILIGIFEKSTKKAAPEQPAVPQTVPEAKPEEVSSGTLKLHNVDEKTAAMIMAIVSDESGIPLSELCFKSIKAIEPNKN